MKTLIVCGTFDETGGKPSGYMRKMFHDTNVELYNGGTWNKLIRILRLKVPHYRLVCWFPNISNNKVKLVQEIKKHNPTCILVTSKNNRDNKYSHKDIVARALNVKSNLLLELTEKNNLILGTVHDPLGNIFIQNEANVSNIWPIISKRAQELIGFTRVRSSKIGEAIDIPDESRFFDLIRGYADRFHELIHAANSDRLLGNASFRCERGFPSFRRNKQIFVSRRNIDKRFISQKGFVAVECKTDATNLREQGVRYYGDIKPSVDTPIQLLLYNHFVSVNYMLHSHTYIKDAPFTEAVIPCGALEEYYHIKGMYPWYKSNFSVNLKGHGSLVLAGDLDYMDDIQYISRPAPEVI